MFNFILTAPLAAFAVQKANKAYHYYVQCDNEKYLKKRLQHFDFKQLEHDVQKVSKEQLKALWDKYISKKWLRSKLEQWRVPVTSEETLAVVNSDAAPNDTRRAEILLKYMQQQINYKFGFCRFLYDSYLSGDLMEILKPTEDAKNAAMPAPN